MLHRSSSSPSNNGGGGDCPATAAAATGDVVGSNNDNNGGNSLFSMTQDVHHHHHMHTADFTENNNAIYTHQKQHQRQLLHLSPAQSLHRFLLLPSQVITVLSLEFLNSFRSFGLRFVLYNYITNEFHITDVHAGTLLGMKGFVDIVFGLSGSILVDIIGVRKISLIAMSVAIIGRTLLAFGRTQYTLYISLFLFSPMGDALLSTGLYRVALKKLTTPTTRPFAFACSYAVSNLAGALADVVVDKMRSGLTDISISSSSITSGVYTPIRQFIVVTWGIVIITFVIAYCFLEDWTVIDPQDLDNDEDDNNHGEGFVVDQSPADNNHTTMMEENDGEIELGQYYSDEEDDGRDENDNYDTSTSSSLSTSIEQSIILPIDAIPASPMIEPHILRRWFPNQYDNSLQQQVATAIDDDDDEVDDEEDDDEQHSSRTGSHSLPRYQMYRTRYNQHGSATTTSICSGIVQLVHQIIAILKLRNTWRVLLFGFLSFTIVLDWTASEMVLPPFLERRFGEAIPIYSIQSINLFGCLILPPFVGALTTGREDFQIILPGLWIMALSPIFVALSPNVWGSCAWQVFMTIGEVLWSPRQIAWTASLAPTGMEGLFFAISSARAILGPVSDMLMGAMNDKYNTNCPECRDSYGHFCDTVMVNNDINGGGAATQCVSVQEECNLYLDTNQQQSCPTTCLHCPLWVATDPSTFWYLLMIAGIAAPLCVWIFLPFLRGTRVRDDNCYGLLQVSKARLLGICGAPDDTDDYEESVRHLRRRQCRQVYGHLENQSQSSSTTNMMMTKNEMDVELT
jgi:hypothetical protein